SKVGILITRVAYPKAACLKTLLSVPRVPLVDQPLKDTKSALPVSWAFRRLILLLWPVQLIVEKFKSTHTVNGVPSLEKIDLRYIRGSQHPVVPLCARKLVGHPLVVTHSVVMSALDHERPRINQPTHFGVIEGIP